MLRLTRVSGGQGWLPCAGSLTLPLPHTSSRCWSLAETCWAAGMTDLIQQRSLLVLPQPIPHPTATLAVLVRDQLLLKSHTQAPCKKENQPQTTGPREHRGEMLLSSHPLCKQACGDNGSRKASSAREVPTSPQPPGTAPSPPFVLRGVQPAQAAGHLCIQLGVNPTGNIS